MEALKRITKPKGRQRKFNTGEQSHRPVPPIVGEPWSICSIHPFASSISNTDDGRVIVTLPKLNWLRDAVETTEALKG